MNFYSLHFQNKVTAPMYMVKIILFALLYGSRQQFFFGKPNKTNFHFPKENLFSLLSEKKIMKRLLLASVLLWRGSDIEWESH